MLCLHWVPKLLSLKTIWLFWPKIRWIRNYVKVDLFQTLWLQELKQEGKQDNTESAEDLFQSLQHFYKDWDYRCLVPDSHEDPTKWQTYDMHRYRTAFSSQSLAAVDTFEHDENFNNWIDPKVLEAYAKDPIKMWKKSYGFNNVFLMRWDGVVSTVADDSLCWWRCAKLVRYCEILSYMVYDTLV